MNIKSNKFFKLVFFLSLFLNFSSLSFSSIQKQDLRVEGTSYYYFDALFEGKAVEERDRYYFKTGKANGKWINFYKNGNLKSIRNWKDGKLNGKYIIYLENGNKVSEVHYTNGKENGKYILFYPNGQLRIEGQYIEGKPVGTWKYFSEDGKLTGKNILE
ncbi:MAG: toxin-antitoxin system YwqK family antitoxin [Fusobacterium sp.]|nr:toxin-antitoxin system YwqK family antitoxin [Fusobacterium sp.]